MILSNEQNTALDRILLWLNDPNQSYFRLGGYAGTGKTTLLQHFINGMAEKPLCCTYTGKAASILARKLVNARVSTIHSLLYKPVPPSMERLDELHELVLKQEWSPEQTEQLNSAIVEEKRRMAEKSVSYTMKSVGARPVSPGQLVIIDEASMVTARMHEDLLRTGGKILYVGDPGQLPPVKDKGFFFGQMDAMLETVHRQAADNPIIRVSMEIRAGNDVPYQEQTLFRKVPKDSNAISPEGWTGADQILTGRNETRRRINRYMRKLTGRLGVFPVRGEKLICLKNLSYAGINFINGIQCNTIADSSYNQEYEKLFLNMLYEGIPVHGLDVLEYPFRKNYDDSAIEDPYQLRDGVVEFDYAYAITVHKSQGSEWDTVILADDGFTIGGRDFRSKWLYTAVTRARQRLIWIS